MDGQLASNGFTLPPEQAGLSPAVQFAMLQAFDHFHDAIAILDPAWHFLYVNDAAVRSLHRTHEQLVGSILWDVFPRLRGSTFEQTYREAMATQQPHRIVQRYLHRDQWFCVGVYPTPEALLLSVRDVTETHRTESLNDRLLKSLENKLDPTTRRKAL